MLPAQLDSSKAYLSFDRGTRPPIPRRAIFHNALFDYMILARENPDWLTKCEPEDTMLMAGVLGYEDLSLKGLSNQLFGVKVYDYKNRQECGPLIYNSQDVFLTRRLYEFLGPQLDGSAYDIDRALVPLLCHASLYSGYEIDHKKLEDSIAIFEREQQILVDTFAEWYPGLNMGSPAQLLTVLPTEDTKAETLEALGTVEAATILRWREVSKVLSTYLYPFRQRDKLAGLYRLTMASGDEKDSAERGGTTTGRLSSYSPNMQNLDPTIQSCLRAPTNYRLLRADYGQIELRCAAEVSQSLYLISAFHKGRDLHQETADMLGVSRFMGKTLNFMCMEPSTQILTNQLEWKRVDALEVGEELVGFDDDPAGVARRWRPNSVLRTGKLWAEGFKITLEDGRTYRVSKEHRWLVRGDRPGRKLRWAYSSGLQENRTRLAQLLTMWEPADSYELGWLAGMFDGEGCLVQRRDSQSIQVTQNPGPELEKMKRLLRAEGFTFNIEHNGNTNVIRLTGGLPARWRLLGSLRPERLLRKWQTWLHQCRMETYKSPLVIKVEPWAGHVIALGTETGTYIAEGFGVHNSLYGGGPGRLQQISGWPREACEDIITRFRQGSWADFFAWADRHWAQVQATGFSVSPEPFRHRRKIHLFDSDAARKEAVNHPIQSMAVYITKAAMLEIQRELPSLQFVNQIHDEVHYLVHKSEEKEMKQRVKEVMLEVGNSYLPLTGIDVDVKSSRYWEPKGGTDED